MRLTDVDYLLNSLPDDLPYKAALKRVLWQAPVIHVKEEQTGQWIKRDNTDKGFAFVCSACGGTAYARPNARGAKMPLQCEYKYCPNCGVRMEVR